MDYLFKLEGSIVPKARPRFGKGRSYLPKRYRLWKENAIVFLKEQLPDGFKAIEKCSINVVIYGSARGDIDNIFGAIADALVQSGVIKDDRLSVLSKIMIEHIPGKDKLAQITVSSMT